MLFIYPSTDGNDKCNPDTWTAYDSECCSAQNPCGSGEGDCDENIECVGNLICGSDNCGSSFPNQNADCCTEGNFMYF